MKNTVIIYFILFLSSSTLLAQKTLNLSLEESIEIAVDSSLQAFRVKNMYMASYWEHRSFKAGRLPSLTFRTSPIEYQRDFTRRYDQVQNIDVYRQQKSLYSSGNLSISQNLDLTGGTFFIDSELGFMRSFGENTFSQFSAVPIRVGYSQALFGFNSFKWEKKIEPLKFEKAKKQFIYSREQIAESVIEYFFSLALAQVEYDMALSNVNSSDTLYLMGQERHTIASISQGDLLTLKLDAVNAKNRLSNANIDLERARFSLASFLNIAQDTEIRLSLPDRPNNIEISVNQALFLAKDNNPDYLSFEQEKLEAEREVDRTTKSSRFEASVSASVGFNQVAGNFSDAYQNPLQQDIVRIGLTIPILDWGVRKGRANIARNNLNVSLIAIQQRRQSLEQDVAMTVKDFAVQQNQISSAEEAMELATLAYDVTKQRFIIGKADLNSLTLSLSRKDTAQRTYIYSLRNYWMSYYRLRKLTLYDFVNQEILSEEFDRIVKKTINVKSY